MVEHHGMLDDANGHLRGDPATYEMIVNRDWANFRRSAISRSIRRRRSKCHIFRIQSRAAQPSALCLAHPTTPIALSRGGKLVYKTLPDVQPREGSVTHVDFGNAWPERPPFSPGDGRRQRRAAVDSAQRVLTVSLPKAEETTFNLSSYLHSVDLDLMGVWNWMREFFEAMETAAMQSTNANTEVTYVTDAKALLTRLVLDGGHEMITPPLSPHSFARGPATARPARVDAPAGHSSTRRARSACRAEQCILTDHRVALARLASRRLVRRD